MSLSLFCIMYGRVCGKEGWNGLAWIIQRVWVGGWLPLSSDKQHQLTRRAMWEEGHDDKYSSAYQLQSSWNKVWNSLI